MRLARVFDELSEHARCLQTQLDDRTLGARLLELATRGRGAADAGDADAMLEAARLSRVVIDAMAEDDRAGLAGDTLKACDACLDRLDLPLTPPPA